MIRLTLVLICCVTLTGFAQNFAGTKKLNGANLFVSIKGKGETLVVLHGGPGLNHSYFKPHLDELEKKFRVVYYDQRASGLSATPSPDSLTIRFFVEDLEALRKRLKIEKLNLLAHSWGAVLATNYSIRYPENIKRILFSNPGMLSREYDQEAAEKGKLQTSKQDSSERAQIIGKGNLQLADYDRLLRLSFRASAFNKKNIDLINLNLPSNFSTASRALFTGLMKDADANANLYDSLRKFNFPVLIVHGKADIIPMSSLDRMRKNLPLGSMIVFENSGHFPFVEERKKFIALVSDYFEGH